MNKQTSILLLAIVIMSGLSLFLAWLGRETTAPDFAQIQLAVDSLDTDRQVMEVNADSLLVLIGKVQRENPEVFSYGDEGDGLKVSCKENQQGVFNRLFLNDASLEDYITLKNSPLTIDLKKYAFTLPVNQENERKFVIIPVELLQSILLSTE